MSNQTRPKKLTADDQREKAEQETRLIEMRKEAELIKLTQAENIRRQRLDASLKAAQATIDAKAMMTPMPNRKPLTWDRNEMAPKFDIELEPGPQPPEDDVLRMKVKGYELDEDGLPILPDELPADKYPHYQTVLKLCQTKLEIRRMESPNPISYQAQLRPERIRIFKDLNQLKKFSPDLHKRAKLSFLDWLKQFTALVASQCSSEVELLANLRYWVEEACWRHWTETLTPQEVNDPTYLMSQLSELYPDPMTRTQHEEAFRQFTQTTPNVLKYSHIKENLFNKAYPGRQAVVDDLFYDYWEAGLCTELRVALGDYNLLHESEKNYSEAREFVVKWASNRTEKNLTYSNFGGSQRIPDKKNTKKKEMNSNNEGECRAWKKNGQCRFGNACKYKHPRVTPITQNPIQNSTTHTPSYAQKPRRSPTEPCAREACKNRPIHESGRCTQPGGICSVCKIPNPNHTFYTCPQVNCRNCREKGHTEIYCSKSKN